jgi:hypothetical protein
MKDIEARNRPERQDRRLREHVHDPYKTRRKLPEPTVCPGCGSVFVKGRWSWAEKPEGANEERCQACHRIADKYPAGYLTLHGGFVFDHKDEIVNLARNTEALENGEHPLHRIMGVEEGEGGIEITTTDIHLPRRIGEALAHAFEGELDFHYDDEAYLIRVSWTRDS